MALAYQRQPPTEYEREKIEIPHAESNFFMNERNKN
jgi:hypothetical protein